MLAKIMVCLFSVAAFIMAQGNNCKSGEILVFFKSGVITLAPGEQKGGIDVILYWFSGNRTKQGSDLRWKIGYNVPTV